MPPNVPRILGIDPGFGRMGWAVIDAVKTQPVLRASGCVVTKKTSAESRRMAELFDHLSATIDQWSPTIVALERLFFQRNTTSAIGVGQARGVVLLASAQHHLPVHEFTPTDVKLATTGYGRADKRQVTRMICVLLGLKQAPKLDDEADAMAIALCASVRRPTHAL